MKPQSVSETVLTAIVLAGGQSSRMGRDKALIVSAGVPWLRRTCEMALACAAHVFVVTGWVDRYRQILPSNCRLITEQPLPGSSLPHGPLVGFAQGLAQVQTEWVLLLACDLPRLNAAAVCTWAEQINVADPAIAWLPQSAKGWEPLCGFYRASCLPELNAAIAQGERSFQRWLGSQNVQALTLADSSLLLNCNTPEDLIRVQE